jgi:uncharacterized protein (DUF983 family)
MPHSFASHFHAILRQRCPRCLEGHVFKAWITMNETCPHCGLVFERERGYFMGAMYISYTLAFSIMGIFMLIWHWLLPEWDLGTITLLAGATFVPFVPMAFRYSRVIWMHFDLWAWPG